MSSPDSLRVAVAQIAPVWMDRDATVQKVADYVKDAREVGCSLVVFGEALVPGYPFWIERTDGARFDSDDQKRMFALYLDQGVVIERGDLAPIVYACADNSVAAYVGVMERAPDRGGHSLYCSLVYIDSRGAIQSVHRKLQPTYEERLAWAPGDGHGLTVHDLGPFRVGGLNCYENWMPLARAALQAQGEDLHVAVWPGGTHNTSRITQFLAMEGRSYVVSAGGLLRPEDIGEHVPLRDQLLKDAPDYFANGGGAIAAPTGDWLIEPVDGQEGLFVADIDHVHVREERQNFDLAGHYARPDVTQLTVNRVRQVSVIFQ